jgi:hypothetical protein
MVSVVVRVVMKEISVTCWPSVSVRPVMLGGAKLVPKAPPNARNTARDKTSPS